MKLCIVIPIYNETPTASEVLSLQSLASKCPGKYDICFIHPESLKEEALEKYDTVIRNIDTKRDKILYEAFQDKFFESTVEYSRLMKECSLYNTFSDYDYILIFQTDCFAIDMSALDDWMERDFDYVGPPIVSNKKLWTSSPCCGNGGLSLRKVSSFIKYTSNEEMRKMVEQQDKKYILYEDLYFCDGVSQYMSVDMPTWEDCAEFGFDMNPDLVGASGYDWEALVGCHAWGKNIPYWKDKLNIPDNIAKEEYKKHKVFIDIYFKKAH